MSDVDVGKMSYAELVSLRDKLEQEIAGKRDEELKVLGKVCKTSRQSDWCAA